VYKVLIEVLQKQDPVLLQNIHLILKSNISFLILTPEY